MNKYIPEIDGRTFTVAMSAVAGSALLSYLIRNVPSGLWQNALGILFLVGPLAALFVYYASKMTERD